MIWTQPNQFGLDKTNLHPSKTIWTAQNHFGPIKRQGIRVLTFLVTFFLLFKCSKVCYWQEKIVNKGCNLLNPYLLMVLLSIPFYKLPCTMASFSGIFVVSISVTHYKRLWIPRSWRHFCFLSLWQLTYFFLLLFLCFCRIIGV